MKKITSIIFDSQEFQALKGDTFTFDDLTPDQIAAITGPQGETCAYDPDDPETPAFTLATTLGQDQTKSVTQKLLSDELQSDRVWAETAVSSTNSVSSDRMYIGTYNDAPAWKSESSSSKGAIFPVTPGKTYKIIATENYSTPYAFVTAKSAGNNTAVTYADANGKQTLAAGGTIYLVAPTGAVYLYTGRKSSSNDTLPTVKAVELTKEHITALGGSITDIVADNEKADSVLSLLGFTTKADVTPTWAGNGYVSNEQKVVSTDSSVTHHSNPISITEGQCIVVKTRVASTIMVLTEDTEVSSGAKYNVLVKGTSAPEQSGVLATYAYIAPRDMKVVISTYSTSTCLVSVWSRDENLASKIPERLYKTFPTGNILAAFDNLVAIGDSLTKGVVYTDSDHSRIAKRPYPKVLQKLCGFDNLTIYAEGGKSADYIWDHFHEQFAVPSTGNTLCIVFLGTNGGFTDTLDTEAPAADNPSTWDMTKRVACYARIVKTFYDLGCSVLLLKPWSKGTNEETTLAGTHNVIDGVAQRYGCAVLKAGDITSNDFKYHCFPTINGVNPLHLNELGYAYFASSLIHAVANLPDSQMQYLMPR